MKTEMFKAGWWATPKEAASFLGLNSAREISDMARHTGRSKYTAVIDERDIQRLGRCKLRVWCQPPSSDAEGRPRIIVKERKSQPLKRGAKGMA